MKKINYMVMCLLVCAGVAGADLKDAKWIWHPEHSDSMKVPRETKFFRYVFDVPADKKIRSAMLAVTADDRLICHINGKRVGEHAAWSKLIAFELKKHIKAGANVIAFEVGNNTEGPAGLLVDLNVVFKKGRSVVVSDGSWLVSKTVEDGWTGINYDSSSWQKAKVIGKYGMAPWGKVQFDAVSKGEPRFFSWPEHSAERPLSSKEADGVLEADWLFQAGYNPSVARIKDEIGWARELVDRISQMKKAPKLKKQLKQLDELERQVEGVEEVEELYLAVRKVKRAIAFSNPLIDFDEILMVDSPYPKMLHHHSGHESGHRNGSQMSGGYGSKLQILKGLHPGGEVRDLLPEGLETYVWRPDLSYNAKKVLFCKKDKDGPSFQIHEVDVDGSNFKQLTKSPYDDLDPIYLPDGKIVFSTTRAHTYVRCLPTSAAFVIARCDADGKNIRIISRNNEPDYLPSLLPNGSLIYTRWEYTERPLWRIQGLWTMNSDGTKVQVYWGNRSQRPDMLIEPRAIPGTSKVMFVGAGHHIFFAGCLGVIDISEGREYPNGVKKVTPDIRWPEVGDVNPDSPAVSDKYHRSGAYAAYKSPWPLGPEDFIVSARDGKEGGHNGIGHNYHFSLYLMDIHGNRELIYKGNNNVWYAMPVAKRKKPQARPDVVNWPKLGEKAEGGALYSADVYEGIEKDLPRGTAKYLRVFQMDSKTYTAMAKTWRHSGPAISVLQEDGVKRILGTVPVEEDGSVNFKVPSGQALHFQLLDENYRCLQIMRSFTGVMPGETRGCVGCHEQNSRAPVTLSSRAIAMKRKPSELTPPPWGAEESISYERFAQPVLDKYCGSCHQGDKNPKARARLDLTLRGGLKERGISDPKLFPFKEPYLTLVGSAWNSPRKPGPGVGIAGCLSVEGTYGRLDNEALQPLKPMTMLSYTSPLIKMMMTGIHPQAQDGSEVKAKIKVEGEDLRRIIAWVDANCVYRGDKEVRMIPDPEGMERFAVKPRIQTAPVIERLQPVTDEIEGRE